MALKLCTDIERFSKNLKHLPSSDCWEWCGPKDKDGYATLVKIGSRKDSSRKQVRLHRWMYEFFVEPIPSGLVIDHLCRNRACQNPFHMEPVTQAVNTKRGARATATHCHKGHPLSGPNVRFGKVPNGWVNRICRTCFREYQSNYQKANGGKYQAAYRERLKEKRKSELATNS